MNAIRIFKDLPIAIVGAGHIGTTVAGMLREAGASVTLIDADARRLAAAPAGIATLRLDVQSEAVPLAEALSRQKLVVSAAPFFANPIVAAAAKTAGAHYFDLTEDVAVTEAVRRLAKDASTAFVPQCGLAPGFIGILGHDLLRGFERPKSLKLRVGALPRFPANGLKYNLTWSTEGLINEYSRPCLAIVDDAMASLRPLEGLETLAVDGEEYEAFNTSGGLGTLTETLYGVVSDLSYKTIRYPGHRDLMRFLLEELRLAERPKLLKEILEGALPSISEDVVIIFASATGEREGRLWQETRAAKILGTAERSAIEATTASGLCAMIELFLLGDLPQRGFVRQEDASLAGLLSTHFGAIFREIKPVPEPERRLAA